MLNGLQLPQREVSPGPTPKQHFSNKTVGTTLRLQCALTGRQADVHTSAEARPAVALDPTQPSSNHVLLQGGPWPTAGSYSGEQLHQQASAAAVSAVGGACNDMHSLLYPQRQQLEQERQRPSPAQSDQTRHAMQRPAFHHQADSMAGILGDATETSQSSHDGGRRANMGGIVPGLSQEQSAHAEQQRQKLLHDLEVQARLVAAYVMALTCRVRISDVMCCHSICPRHALRSFLAIYDKASDKPTTTKTLVPCRDHISVTCKADTWSLAALACQQPGTWQAVLAACRSGRSVHRKRQQRPGSGRLKSGRSSARVQARSTLLR